MISWSLRHSLGLGLVACGVALVLASATGVLDGERAKYVHVRWRPDVADEVRADLESRFALVQPQHLDGNTFGYDLGNATWWNIRALVRHPAVVDTQNLDRERFRVAETADDGDSGRRTGLAWRWGVENLIPYAVLSGLLLAGLGALLLALPHLRRRFSLPSVRRHARSLSRLKNILGAALPRGLSLALLVTLAVLALRVLAETPAGDPEAWLPWLELQWWAPLERFIAASLLATGTFITLRVPILRFGAGWAGLVVLFVAVWAWPAGATSAGFCMYAFLAWASTCAANARTPDRSWLLVLLTAVAFAARVDQGLYFAAATVAALFVRHYQEGIPAFRVAALTFAGSLTVLALAIAPLGDLPGSLSRFGDRIGQVAAAPRQPADFPGAAQQSGLASRAETFNIRWAPEVDSAQRVAKEQQYALAAGNADPGDESGQTWQYAWDDRLSAGLLRMLEDPAIEDTHGIDRTSGRYIGDGSSQDEAPFAVLRRGAVAIGNAASSSGLQWLWILLPLWAAIRLVRRTVRRSGGHTDAAADMSMLPALMLCLPVAWNALHDAGNFARIAAPAIPALAVVVAWVLAPKDRIRSSIEEPSPAESASTHAGRRPARRIGDVYFYGGLAALTVLVHLYVHTDLLNDHAAYLAMARQIVYGDWPIRDFRDDGSLLQILLSAGVQEVGGFRLLGEMLLAWTFLAAANCLTFRLAVRLSGSRAAAVVVTVLALLLVPRPYGYPKIFIYPLAILVLWRYLGSPGMGRLAAVAATTALAFLFRIDHGVVVAVTSVMTLAAVHGRQPQVALRQGLMFAGWFLLFALPQALYVFWSVGLQRYAESILTFGAYANATREPWPAISLSPQEGLMTEANAAVLLLYVFAAIVAFALFIAVRDGLRAWSRGSEPSHESLQILVVGATWALMLPMLARGQYYTRVAEIGQPVAILGAWVAMRWLALALRPVVKWSALGTVAATMLVALCCRTPVARFFANPADVFRGVPFQSEVLSELAISPPIDAYAPSSLEGDRWVVRYAELCTKPDDRLLVTWFGPEVYLYAGRAFAGDRWVYLPFDNSPERQRQVVEKLRTQPVPVVFVDPAQYAAFEESWPAIATYLDNEYTVAADVSAAGQVTRVLAWKHRPPSRRLSFANLPCFD